MNECRVRDLTVEKRKVDANQIVLMLVEGNKLMVVPKHEEA